MSYHSGFMHPELRVQAQYDVRSEIPSADQAGLLIPKLAGNAGRFPYRPAPKRTHLCGTDTPASRFDTAMMKKQTEIDEKYFQGGAKSISKDIRRVYGSHSVWCPLYRQRIDRKCTCECDADCGCPDCEACRCKCSHTPVYQTKATPLLSAYTSNVATVAQASSVSHPLRSEFSDRSRIVDMKPAKFAPSLANSRFRKNEFMDEWQSNENRGGSYPGLVSVRVDTYSSLNQNDHQKHKTLQRDKDLEDSLEGVVNGTVLVAQREAALLAWKQRRVRDIKSQGYQKEDYSNRKPLKLAPYATGHYLKKKKTPFIFPESKETIAVGQRYAAAVKNLSSSRNTRLEFEKKNMDVLGHALSKRVGFQPEGEELDMKGLYKWAYSSEKMGTGIFSTKRKEITSQVSDRRLNQLRRGADRYTADDEDEVNIEGVRGLGENDSELKKRLISGMTDAMNSQKFQSGPRDLHDLANSQRNHQHDFGDYSRPNYMNENTKRKVEIIACHNDRAAQEKLNAFDRARRDRWDEYRKKLGNERISDLPEEIVQDIEAINEAQKSLVKLLKSELKAKYQLRKENEATRRDAWMIQQALHEQTIEVSALRNRFTKMEQEKQEKVKYIRELYGEDVNFSDGLISSPHTSSPNLSNEELIMAFQPFQAVDITTSIMDSYKSADYLSGLFAAQLALPPNQPSVLSSEPETDNVSEDLPPNVMRGLLTSYFNSCQTEISEDTEDSLTGCNPSDLVTALSRPSLYNDDKSGKGEKHDENEELEPELKMELQRIEAGIDNQADDALGCLDPDLVYPSVYSLLMGVGHTPSFNGWVENV